MSSNWISCRRVKFQEINAAGKPIGKPTYGILVADDFCQGYNDTFKTLKALNHEIKKIGMIALVEGAGCDFGVNADDQRWKGANFCGARILEPEGDDNASTCPANGERQAAGSQDRAGAGRGD